MIIIGVPAPARPGGLFEIEAIAIMAVKTAAKASRAAAKRTVKRSTKKRR